MTVHLKEASLRALCGITGYTANLTNCPEEVSCKRCLQIMESSLTKEQKHRRESINSQTAFGVAAKTPSRK